MPHLKGPVPQAQAKEGPMPQLVKKRRSGWAVLAAGALVASLLAVGTSPAVALDDKSKPNAAAATSACVDDATGDMMFSDVSEGHAFRADINCLAYYRLTVGYGDGTFRPNADVSNEEMVLFMERAAEAAGADAEAVVGDFAMTGSDPVHRGDMALLIARLLVASTTKESTPNVTNNADGTFAVSTVMDKDWDYFADSRRSQNRVHDSAASALYELGVAKGTGMGYFSPASTVSRGAMAAFITRALAHTTARPEGVTIQSDEPGGVIVSVRDANFRPLANAVVDVFSVPTPRLDEAFNADGSCNTPRLRGEGGDTSPCEIGAVDAVTGLSGDYDPGAILGVQPGGRTVFAWTGDSGDKVEDGAEGLASISLTETAPTAAAAAKVTADPAVRPGSGAMGIERVPFGTTVTVTIQLVGNVPGTSAVGAGSPNAVPPTAGSTYTVTIRSASVTNSNSTDGNLDGLGTAGSPGALTDLTGGTTVETKTVTVDASGKGTFEITAADPDPNNQDDEADATVDYVTVTYSIAGGTAGTDAVNDDISHTTTGSQTIRFSDAPSVFRGASVTPTVKYLAAPRTGSASNVVTVKVFDQYGNGVRGHEVVLTGSDDSTFPLGQRRARRTDSSGTVRIGYSYDGTGVIETLTARTEAEDPTTVTDASTLAAIPGGTAMFYWVATPTAAGDVTAADIRAVDVEKNIVVIGGSATEAPQLLVYDDNDQFVVDGSNATLAAFEEALARPDPTNNDTVGAQAYNPTDASVVARFTVTQVP